MFYEDEIFGDVTKVPEEYEEYLDEMEAETPTEEDLQKMWEQDQEDMTLEED